MILLCGIPSEPPLARVIEALDQMNASFAVFNQRHFATTDMTFEIGAGGVSGWLEIQGKRYPLEQIRGVYTRQMDYRLLPELKDVSASSDPYRDCAALHDTFTRWCEISPARVVNRGAPMGSNSSKPYQAQLIQAYGFEVPETLITNDPGQVLEFRDRHKRIIYKSTSGIRSIVQMFGDEDVARLSELKWCPTQFQQYVEGVDVRVHVVGPEVFATRIESSATDYRYASTQVGEAAGLTATELSDEVTDKCVRLADGLGLAFAGIDLKFAPDGRVVCFEVNPSPGYSYFEANSGQPIARAVARYLTGEA
jgi:glutathione synthase/RimK-type ligase-like ATP-grasp enzyme